MRTILEGDRDTRADSVATLVDYSRTRVPLTLEDFLDAFEGYAPVALRGVPLQKPTRADFSHVGGMVEAKKTLVEYIHWPSKVSVCVVCVCVCVCVVHTCSLPRILQSTVVQ